jgi:tRNA uridine 5-carboxymethylaminomethyl modification enzyme
MAFVLVRARSSSNPTITQLLRRISAECGTLIQCSQVVLCTGTFLAGEIHVGLRRFPAGRWGDRASPPDGLSRSLVEAGFALGRLQTGTPARLDKSTIRFDGLEVQEGEHAPEPFSFVHREVTNAVSTRSWHSQHALNDIRDRIAKS